jgi:hypothetical protein
MFDSTASSREVYLEAFRDEVEAAAMRAWIHLRHAPEVILSARSQLRWKAIQELSVVGLRLELGGRASARNRSRRFSRRPGRGDV